jgi:hypothetical protein
MQDPTPGLPRYRYVAVHWGGPGAALADGDAEIDAVCIPSNGKG